MTSWSRKQIKQHKELFQGKYRQRVVPLLKKELIDKAVKEESEKEVKEYVNTTGHQRSHNR